VTVDGEAVHGLDREGLYRLRRRMSMLFQFGALFTDLSVFENVAFPLREHTTLPEQIVRDLVLLKLEAVGLRGAHPLMPAELSGGMARRVALARALVLDPTLVLYDEPFAGLDPIALAVVGQLVRRLNDALGATSIVVSHDVKECLQIVDYIYFMAEGRIVAQGTPDEMRSAKDPQVRQFIHGETEGHVPFHVPTARIRRGPRPRPASAERRMIARLRGQLSQLGHGFIDGLWRMGSMTRFFVLVLSSSGTSFQRMRLIRREIYFTGVLSFVIIAVSGLFVGMVLGLQGYETLQRYGATESIGMLVALSLVRELGPVVSALLFASRAGSAITAEIGLMKATEQLTAMDMMAVSPMARVVAPRFWAGVISMPLLAAIFSAMGVFGGYLVGVVLIGVDAGAFWSQMQAAVDVRYDVLNGVIKSIVFGIAVCVIATFEGFDAPPTAEGVSGATTRTVVSSALTILALDLVLTAFMLRADD
jgi:phospholipid/cholesterol/gamma-HCH transport system permease protein